MIRGFDLIKNREEKGEKESGEKLNIKNLSEFPVSVFITISVTLYLVWPGKYDSHPVPLCLHVNVLCLPYTLLYTY